MATHTQFIVDEAIEQIERRRLSQRPQTMTKETREEKNVKFGVRCSLFLATIYFSAASLGFWRLDPFALLPLCIGLICIIAAIREGQKLNCLRWLRQQKIWDESKKQIEAKFGKFEYNKEGH